MTMTAEPLRSDDGGLTPRLARTHLDALIADAPPRALVVGSAGSGKSRVLRHLRAALSGRGVDVVIARPGLDLAGVAAADVVLVDDAHLLDEGQLAGISDRLDDPAAGIVVACRPWPQSDALRQVTRRLEASRAAIVLGHVTAADALDRDVDPQLAPACVTDVLERCGNATWLVSEALSLHDGEACSLAPRHDAIAEALQEVIAHRMQTLAPEVRAAIEVLCLAPRGSTPASVGSDLLAAGHAEGLLQRNGQPAPVVRDAVRATVSVQRIAELLASDDVDDTARAELLGDVRDPRIASALLTRADAAVHHDPVRAAELYERAGACGADPEVVQLGRARAAWALGQLDTAGAVLDVLADAKDPAVRHKAAELSAAVWAARGLLAHSHATYQAMDATAPAHLAAATVAAVAVGDPGADVAAPAGTTVPSTLSVAADLLARGLRGSVQPEFGAALGDLVRAAEMYSATGSSEPVPELPAVVAALAAVHTGELETAAGVLDGALRAGHAGRWARPRLQLWRAWIDLQWQRPNDVESTLSSVGPVSPRERILVDALRVGLARRYSDAAGLATAWRSAQETVLRAQFDLYGILPLGEFAVSASRVGDADRVRGHVTRALVDMQRLGSPPLWAPHLHWTGIQQGILAGRPDSLRPHAQALVAASSRSRVAANMATAGRVWTAVLGGNVDADAVEDAALGLADVGLAWDGARLAGHGAGRTDDRRTISRLLACARQLHPHEELRTDGEDVDTPPPARTAATLSAREREVAVLVVQGMTYSEIGETIFISPRTAEHHIARIRRRLGATSRSDLIAKLRAALDGGATTDPRGRGDGTRA